MKTKCKYQRNTDVCNSLPILRWLRVYSDIQEYAQTEENGPAQQLVQSISNGEGYFVGCDNWQLGEKRHWFKPLNENVDIDLFKKLLDGKVSVYFVIKLHLNMDKNLII